MDEQFKKNIQVLVQYPEWQSYLGYLKKWLKDIEVVKYEKGDDLNVIGARVVGMCEMKRLLELHLSSIGIISKQASKSKKDESE